MSDGKRSYHKPNEYDYILGGIVGNFNFIIERYPKDSILIKRVQSLASLCLQMGALIGYDQEYLDKFNAAVRGGRK